MKKSHHTFREQGKASAQELTEFLSKNGQIVLPMVDLIEQCQLACEELIDVTGRAAIQAVLQLSAAQTAGGEPQQGKWRGRKRNRGWISANNREEGQFQGLRSKS